jgi:hypothetical protein
VTWDLGFRSRIDPADADVLAGGASQVELDPGTVAAEEEASGGGLVEEERIWRRPCWGGADPAAA